MKKSIGKVLAILLSFMFVFQTSFIALANDNEPDWVDIEMTQEEFDSILALNEQSNSSSMSGQSNTQATNLIFAYSIAVSGSGTTLKIAGKTNCNPDVVKCGFSIITIQRRTSSTASWTTYKTYEDLYNNTFSYALAKSITVASNYQYRITCTHYAKKNLLSTQKINNTSNVVYLS